MRGGEGGQSQALPKKFDSEITFQMKCASLQSAVSLGMLQGPGHWASHDCYLTGTNPWETPVLLAPWNAGAEPAHAGCKQQG